MRQGSSVDGLRRRALLPAMLSLWGGLQVPAQAQVPPLANLPDLIDRAKPSVVLVGSYSELDSPRFSFRGTGFVVADGRSVITNAHVVLDASEPATRRVLMVQVWHPSQGWQPRAARLLRSDRSHDLAVLELEGERIPALELSAAALPREGTSIALMGFPIGGVLGYAHVTHRGIVASLTRMALPALAAQSLDPRAVRSLRAGNDTLLQLDAIAYPGNSGGPVFDLASGQVIGVISMVLVKATRESALSQPTGITYAIPAANVRDLLAP